MAVFLRHGVAIAAYRVCHNLFELYLENRRMIETTPVVQRQESVSERCRRMEYAVRQNGGHVDTCPFDMQVLNG